MDISNAEEKNSGVQATPGWTGLYYGKIGPFLFVADWSLVQDFMIGFNTYRGGHVGYARAIPGFVHLGIAVGLLRVMLAVEIRGRVR